MKVHALLITGVIILAGCASEPHHMEGLDTGDIAPNAEDSLTFEATTTIHCHPHPWMSQNVTVTDDAPSDVHVHIVDGLDAEEYRFEPEDLTIGKGSRVTYHNHGNFTHTATEKADDAATQH
jgi:plastocyanin